MRNRATRQPLSFEIWQRRAIRNVLLLAYLRDLARAGIAVTVRAVDAVQFDQRRLSFDLEKESGLWSFAQLEKAQIHLQNGDPDSAEAVFDLGQQETVRTV